MEYITRWSKQNKTREGKLTEAHINAFIKESEQEFLNIPNLKQEMDERDVKLLEYLIANHHTSPLEHMVFTFSIHCTNWALVASMATRQPGML